MSRSSWAKAYEVLARHRRRLLRRKGVVAVDVGVKIRRGRPSKTPSLRVHVLEKPAPDRLPARRLLPKRIEGVPVDVIRARYRPLACSAAAAPLRKFRNPLLGGVSVGRLGSVTFGTLAAIVVNPAGTKFALSNRHVTGASTTTMVVQPHASGFGIGRVARAVLDERMDASVVRLGPQRQASGGLATGPITGILDPIPDSALPLRVRMIGACSGDRTGFVTSTSFSVTVDYGSGVEVDFENQLHIISDSPNQEFSRGGDSGALVVEAATGRAVGLLFAGEPDGEADYAVASPIAAVLTELGVGFL